MKQKLNLRFLMAFAIGMIMSVSAMAQITVKGNVKDDFDVIVGASVKQLGTSNGCLTDMDGNFTLKVPKGSKIVISYMGYVAQTLTAAPVMNVTLQEDSKMLEEAVVIGYGSVKKDDMTGSVAAFKPDEKNRGMITSAQELIQGKVAGVNVSMGSGEPGGGATITIRGGSSLNASNKPLIVIDGMILDNNDTKGMSNPLSLVNPNDIESFTVLKDASACAIYGSRGSNGVIIITTKKGRSDSPVKISYNGSVSVSQKTKTLDVMDAEEYTNFIKSYYAGTDNYDKAVALLGNANTDWQDEIYRTAVSSDHNITFQGGLKAKDVKKFNMPWRVSLGFTEQNGILKGSDYKRFTAGVSFSPEFLDKHLTFNLNGKFVKSWQNPGNQSAIGAATSMDPTQPIKSSDSKYANYNGYYEWVQDAEYGDANYPYVHQNGPANPVEQVNQYNFEKRAWLFLGNVEGAYKIHGLEDLSLHFNLSGEWTSGLENTNQPFKSLAAGYYGSFGTNTEDKLSLQASAYINYNHEFNKNHRLDATAGYEWSKLRYDGVSDYWGLIGGMNKYYGVSADVNGQTIDETLRRNETITPWGSTSYIVSWYGRFNYTLMNRYLFTFTGRADGSSRFAKGNKWGFFPAAAVAWRVNDEPFMKNAKCVSDLKFRFSWGKTGQQDIGKDFYYLPTYTSNTNSVYTYPMAGNPDGYVAKPNAYNSDLRWETTSTWNVGFDLGFLNQRITIGFDAYIRKTTDLFNLNTVPTGTNFNNKVYSNVGSLSNRGFEVQITARPIVTKDWYWEVGFNFGYNKNRIEELYGGNEKVEASIYHNQEAITYHKVGLAANSFYVYQQVYDKDGLPIQGVYVDRDGNGVIDGNDKYWYKSINHPYNGGFSSRLQYKNWDLGFNLRYSIGGYVYNELESGKANVGQSYVDKGAGWLENTTADLAKMGWSSYLYGASDYFVQNASYLKMDNLTLGYNFSNFTRWKLNGRLAFAVSNVFTITKYKGLDPEQNGGCEGSLYPRPRTYTLSVNLNF